MNSLRILSVGLSLIAGLVSFAKADVKPADVIVTLNADEVKGLKRIGEVSATGKAKVFATPDGLRQSATEQIQAQAAKLGATHIFIEKAPSYGPFQNPLLVGFAYAPADRAAAEISSAPVAPSTLPTIDGVRVTRDREAVKGLTRVGDVKANAKKLFGNADKLREKATADVVKQAKAQGATIILIEFDEFAQSPINNVSIEGGIYK